VGLKVGFKPIKQVYQSVSKNNDANISGKKKQAGLDRQEVSNSNLFDSLNSVENDDDLERINNLEQQMLDGKLVLMDDDGKPLKKGLHLMSSASLNDDTFFYYLKNHDDVSLNVLQRL
ncbi:hypothetical protein Tco_1224973, partial [Tanacetum coccineum]